MHHINGNRQDNRLENLQLLCPNCHAQTHNYCGKNKHNSLEDKLNLKYTFTCKYCGKTFKSNNKKQIYCSQECSEQIHKDQRKHSLPTVEELEKLYLKFGNFKAVGKELGVSDKTVAKYFQELDLPSTCKELRSYIQDKYGKQLHWKEILCGKRDMSNFDNHCKKSVDVFTIDGHYVETLESIIQTARKYGVDKKTISRICYGINTKSKDYIFKFHKN